MIGPTEFRLPFALAKYPFLPPARCDRRRRYEGFDSGTAFFLEVFGWDSDLGPATLPDENVLIVMTSLLVKEFNAGKPLPQTLVVKPNAVLRALGRGTSGRDRELLRQSLQRLHATAIATNLTPHGKRHFLPVNLIEQLLTPARGAWEIRVSPWIKEQIEARQIMRVEPSYLRLRGLDRRLAAWCMALARDPNRPWKMPLKQAYFQSGSTDQFRKFSHDLRKRIEAQPVAGFTLAITGTGKEQFLTLVAQPTLLVTGAERAHVHEGPNGFVSELPDYEPEQPVPTIVLYAPELEPEASEPEGLTFDMAEPEAEDPPQGFIFREEDL